MEYICFETNTIGITGAAVNVDDVLETVNHFRCIDYIIDHASEQLTLLTPASRPKTATRPCWITSTLNTDELKDTASSD